MSDTKSRIWLIGVSLGSLLWISPEVRGIALDSFWIKFSVALLCGLFVGFYPLSSRLPRSVAGVGLLVVCWTVAMLGGFITRPSGQEFDVWGTLVSSLGLVLLPFAATVIVLLRDSRTTGRVRRGCQLGILVLVLAPVSTVVALILVGFVFGRWL